MRSGGWGVGVGALMISNLALLLVVFRVTARQNMVVKWLII